MSTCPECGGGGWTNRRRVFVFFEPEQGGMPQSERAKRYDALLAGSGADPGHAPAGATAEQTLSGLYSWVKSWLPHPANDDARIVLMYDPGYRDERAAMFNAVCDPEAFIHVLGMATPDEWRKKGD